MTTHQRNILQKLQAMLGIINDEAKQDLTFAQQLHSHNLFHGKLPGTGLTISHLLHEDAEKCMNMQDLPNIIQSDMKITIN